MAVGEFSSTAIFYLGVNFSPLSFDWYLKGTQKHENCPIAFGRTFQVSAGGASNDNRRKAKN